MSDWRTSMQGPFSSTHYPRNPQKGSHRSDSEDIEDFAHRPNQSEPVTIEPAHPHARPVYWERASGEIVGPAKPEFLAKVGNGPRECHWLIAIYHDSPVWIRSECLRSKQQFETQVKPQVVELMKDPT